MKAMGMETQTKPNLAPAPQTDAEITEAGCRFLGELGLDASLGNILLDGGREGCEGTLAQYVGVNEHDGVRLKIIKTVNKARLRSQDIEEALIDKLDFVIKRDEHDEIMRAPASAESPIQFQPQEAEKK